MKSKDQFEHFAFTSLKSIFNSPEHERIFQCLRAKEEKLAFIDRNLFGQEYLAFCLALASLSWLKACTENQIDDEEIKKIYLKAVMHFFQSPQFVNLAAAFSHYVYAPKSPNESMIPLAESFFIRIGAPLPEAPSEVPSQLQILVSAAEGFRSEFENQFFQFLYSEAG